MVTWEDRDKLFPEFKSSDYTRDYMGEERERQWVDFCFEAYEHDGFCEEFQDIYDVGGDGTRKYDGQKFKVLGRVSESDADICTLPMWTIGFEDGYRTNAYPEEICLNP